MALIRNGRKETVIQTLCCILSDIKCIHYTYLYSPDKLCSFYTAALMREQVMTMHYQQSFRLFSGDEWIHWNWQLDCIVHTKNRTHIVEEHIYHYMVEVDHWPFILAVTPNVVPVFNLLHTTSFIVVIVWTKMYVQICAHCSNINYYYYYQLKINSNWIYFAILTIRMKIWIIIILLILTVAFGVCRNHRWYVWWQRKNWIVKCVHELSHLL